MGSPDAEPPDSEGGMMPPDFRTLIAENRTLAAVLAITVGAFLARLLFLGDRIAHFDEGRVGWWAINYMNTGEISYRYIIHGPLVQHINRWLFEVAGANDFTMRLPIAIIGGLLPLSVFLYREHLRDAELVAVAFFLGFNPVLVYYSRFFRSTLPVAAFGFVAFGLLVRFYDTRKPRYVHGAAAMAALMLAAKENAVAYYITWLGAGVVIAYHVLVRGSGRGVIGRLWTRYLRRYVFARSALPSLGGVALTAALFFAFRSIGTLFPSTPFDPLAYLVVAIFIAVAIVYGVFTDRGPYGVLGHVLLALVIFVGIAFFFYSPRAGDSAGPGFWKPFGNLLTAFVDLVTKFDTGGFSTVFDSVGRLYEVTVNDFTDGYEYWFGGAEDKEREKYVSFLGRFLETMGQYAAPVLVLSFIGAVVELFGSREPRYVVVAVFAWGFASIFGYPLGTDIYGGWITVNAVLPLALPAGVGLGVFYRRLTRSWPSGASSHVDVSIAGIVAIVFLVVVGSVGVGLVTGVYMNDAADENSLVQYAQPGTDDLGDMRPAIKDMRTAAAANEGTDVLFYGDGINRDPDRRLRGGVYPRCSNVGNALPLHWYVNITGSTADCAYDETALEEFISESEAPPVVVSKDDDADAIEQELPNYVERTYLLRTRGDKVTFFIHPDYASATTKR